MSSVSIKKANSIDTIFVISTIFIITLLAMFLSVYSEKMHSLAIGCVIVLAILFFVFAGRSLTFIFTTLFASFLLFGLVHFHFSVYRQSVYIVRWVVLALAAITGTILALRSGNRKPLDYSIFSDYRPILLIYFGWIAFTGLLGESVFDSLEKLAALVVIYFFCIFALPRIASPQQLRDAFVKSILIITYPIIIASLLQLIIAPGFARAQYKYLGVGGGTFCTLAFVSIPFIWYAFKTYHKWRHLHLSFLILTVFSLIAASSRGYILAAGLATGVACLLYNKKAIAYLLISVIAVGSVTTALIPDWLSRILGSHYFLHSGYYSKGDITTGRIQQWEYALALSSRKPLTGKGIGYGLPNIYLPSAPFTGVTRSVWCTRGHGEYFTALVETGIPGLLLYLTFIFVLLRRTYLLSKSSSSGNQPDNIRFIQCCLWLFIGWFSAIFLATIFIGAGNIGQIVVWTVIGISVAYPLHRTTVTE